MRANIILDLRMINRNEKKEHTLKGIIADVIEHLVQSVMSLGQAWKQNEQPLDFDANAAWEDLSTSFRLPPRINGHWASRSFVRIVVQP
jgi:hypothetical protein